MRVMAQGIQAAVTATSMTADLTRSFKTASSLSLALLFLSEYHKLNGNTTGEKRQRDEFFKILNEKQRIFCCAARKTVVS
jgi:hypothetical protein